MDKIRTAVIGVGYLGRFHAQKYADLPESELVAVVDVDARQRNNVATELDVPGREDYHGLEQEVDAVSIVVPTRFHYEVARHFLDHGVHVLLEKPVTTTVEEARELIDLAAKRGALLQVGHLERFNAAYRELEGAIQDPMFIESHRLAPFKPRGTDVSVVLDLMIHDIDIIQSLVRSPLEKIDASGVGVLTSEIDIANVRLGFANGCVANVTASRVSLKSERKMRFFQRDTYVSVDFQERNLAIFRKGEGEMYPGVPNIASTQYSMDQQDPLREEIAAFLASVRDNTPPLVTGEDGLRALETAIRIGDLLDGQRLG